MANDQLRAFRKAGHVSQATISSLVHLFYLDI